MATFADLELSLRNLNGRDHAVGLRFNLPSSAGKVQPPESQGGLQKARFDLEALGWAPQGAGKSPGAAPLREKGVLDFRPPGGGAPRHFSPPPPPPPRNPP